VLNWEQKRQIYDRHGEEGLKAHEGGQHQYANPFDMFSQFFGGGCTYTVIIGWVYSHLTSLFATQSMRKSSRSAAAPRPYPSSRFL
jgi:DnaJ-class molecular chaperone